MARAGRLAEVFVELADTLVEEFDVVEFLQVLTERCIELVDADAAGLMLSDQRGNLQVVASTHESARLLDLFELQRQEGPSLESFHTGRVIAHLGLADAAQRWPTFAQAARDVGFRTGHALPLKLRRQVIGSLNLFNTAGRPLTEDQLAVVGLLHERALHDQRLLAEQLQAALESRILIEQAKGVLAARAGTSVASAFALLRTHARRTGQPLAGVAEAVIAGLIRVDEFQRSTGPGTGASTGNADHRGPSQDGR